MLEATSSPRGLLGPLAPARGGRAAQVAHARAGAVLGALQATGEEALERGQLADDDVDHGADLLRAEAVTSCGGGAAAACSGVGSWVRSRRPLASSRGSVRASRRWRSYTSRERSG